MSILNFWINMKLSWLKFLTDHMILNITESLNISPDWQKDVQLFLK